MVRPKHHLPYRVTKINYLSDISMDISVYELKAKVLLFLSKYLI